MSRHERIKERLFDMAYSIYLEHGIKAGIRNIFMLEIRMMEQDDDE